MKYDDVSWHIVRQGQPEEFGGTHIALFLRWCFCKGWAGPAFDEPELVEKVASGRIPATEFLFRCCDGKLVQEMLSEDGNAFAEQYYGNDGLYLDDYARGFGKLMYSAPDSAHDFAKFSAMLDGRLRSGVLTKPKLESKKVELPGWGSAKVFVSPEKSAKPWWKLW